MRDVTVVHPGVQHSGELARVLDQRGRLAALLTGLQIGDDAPWPWTLPRVRAPLSRRVVQMPDHRILRLTPYRTAASRALARLPERFRENELDESRFIRRALTRLPADTRAVVGTDMSSGELFRVLSEERPDVLRILDVSHPTDFRRRALVQEDAERWGLPVAAYDDWRESPILDQSLELRLADRILVASRFSRDCVVADGADPARISIVPYGIDSTSTPVANSVEGVRRFVFVGAMSERKGMTLLLRAFDRLRSQGDVALEIFGGRHQGYRVPTHLPANVHIRGNVSRAQLNDSIRTADALVLPSMCEGFGRVLLEALALGTPVLTTDRSGGPDILESCPTAPVTVVPYDERGSLDTWLSRMPSATLPVRHAAQATAQMFSEDRYAKDLTEVIDRSKGLPPTD